MPLTRRYHPTKAPAEVCLFGFDFSPILPPGLALTNPALAFFTNTQPPVTTHDLTQSGLTVRDASTLYAEIQGGVAGTDYLLQWSATDTAGNVWTRTAALLCADTA